MSLESTWRITAQKHQENDSYSRDYKKDKSNDKDHTVASLIGLATVAFLGKKAYDNGMLDEVAHSALKMASTMEPKNFDDYVGVRNRVTNALEKMNANFDHPVREFANFFKEAEHRGIGATLDHVKQNTTEDFNILKDEFAKMKEAKKKSNEYFSLNNTDLDHYLYQSKEALKNYNVGMGFDGEIIHSESEETQKLVFGSLFDELNVDADENIADINNTKTRKVVIGDLVKLDTNKKQLVNIGEDDFKLNDEDLQSLNQNLLLNFDTKDGYISEFNKIKDFRVDKFLRKDIESGKILDSRFMKEKALNVSKFLTDDIKIPFIGINPFRLFGQDDGFNIFKRDVKFAGINSSVEQPLLDLVNGGDQTKSVKTSRLFVDGDVFKFNKDSGKMEKEFSNMRAIRIDNSDKTSDKLNNKADLIRKMTGKRYKKYTKFNIEDDGIRKTMYGNIMHGLDIGFQDVSREKIDIFDPMSYSNAIGAILEKAKPYKSEEITNRKLFRNKNKNFEKGIPERVAIYDEDLKNESLFTDDDIEFVNSFDTMPILNSDELEENNFEISDEDLKAFNKMMDIESTRTSAHSNDDSFILINKSIKINDLIKNPSENSEKFLKQFFSGDKNKEFVTDTTLDIYNMFARLDKSFASFGMGASRNMSSTGDYVFNHLLMKRVVPVYLGFAAYQYANYKTEEVFGQEIEDRAADMIVGADLSSNRMRDSLGITEFAKENSGLFAGGEQIAEIPLFGQVFDLDDTVEETKEAYETGEVAVRKGRWWSLGNTAFTGGKVDYYAPNWYRRIKADVNYTDSKYGSKEEWLEHVTFIPNPKNSFGLKKVFSRENDHYYDKKHYHDRPYLMTASPLAEVPIIGGILAATVGEIFAPPVKMHEEDWLKLGEYLENDDKFIENSNFNKDVVTDSNFVVPQLITDEGKLRALNDEKDALEISKLIANDIPSEGTFENLAIDKIIRDTNNETNSMELANNENDNILFDKQEIIIPNEASDIKPVASRLVDDVNDLFGIYGYGADAFGGIKSGDDNYVIENPGYEKSLNDNFWDAELGGMGGELSEIYRRLFNKKPKGNYINPIRNTQASWLPGEDYYIDFQHGDPYSKIKRGEMRLPGEGYEKINQRNELFKIAFTVDDVTKSEERIVQDYLHTEIQETSEYLEYTRSKGRQLEFRYKEFLNEKGILKENESTVYNDEFNIAGTYDGTILDEKSPQKEAPLEIKSLSNKDFEELEQASYSDVEKMNFIISQKGYDRGHIVYINRNDETKTKTFSIKQNENLYFNTLLKAKKAKYQIIDEVESGRANKSEAYSPFERFKILADVALYSKEFKHYKSIVNNMALTPEQEKEKNIILNQSDERYKSVRTYNYRFKNRKTKTVKATVTNVLDNGDLMTDYYEKNVKLAGIKNVNKDVLEKNLLGKEVQLELDTDNTQIKIDGLIKANVMLNDKNFNKKLVYNEDAEYDEEDFSAPGVLTRYNSVQRGVGRIWENFAHMHTYYNTKQLQVRSGVESYKRRDLYGKDFQNWEHPIEDFIVPFHDQLTETDTITKDTAEALKAPVSAYSIGRLFGRTKYGKVAGILTLGGTVAVRKVHKNIKELITGEEFIPKRRIDEWEHHEYLDKLKYVRNKNISKKYFEAAKDEGFDIDKFNKAKKDYTSNYYYTNTKKRITGVKEFASRFFDKELIAYLKVKHNDIFDENNKYEVIAAQDIAREKRVDQKRMDFYGREKADNLEDAVENFFYGVKLFKDEIKVEERKVDTYYNEQLVEMIQDKAEYLYAKARQNTTEKKYDEEKKKLWDSEMAKKGMYYEDVAEKETMYGFDHYDNIYDVYKAIPKADRKYLDAFKGATEEEKKELLALTPKYLRRILEHMWGLKMEKKTNLKSYFKKHALPDDTWIGFNPYVDMKVVDTKIITNSKMDVAEFDIWDQDVKRARLFGDMPIPKINKHNKGKVIDRKLKTLLADTDLEDITVEYTESENDELNIDVVLQRDKRKELNAMFDDVEEFI